MLRQSSALVLIDLQNDFLAPSASFAVDEKAQISLRDMLETLVPAFRSAGGRIIWIKSHYAVATREWKDKVNAETSIGSDTSTPQIENSVNELDTYNKLKWVIEGTHIGKRPCCQAGTLAAEFPPWVQNLVDPEDSTTIKTYYSAFKANQLRAILEEKEIKNIYFAGLLSNICVLATALYAVRLAKEIRSEWSVYTIVDALAWRNDKSHLKALETMQHEGVRLITSEEVIAINHTT